MNTQLKHLVEDYVSFWKKMTNLKQGQGPFIHPDDMDYLSQKEELWFRGKDASRYDLKKDKNKIHVDLLPSPYVGDIMNAKVIILMGNPGIEKPQKGVATPREYLDHKKTILWDALVSTLHQDFTKSEMKKYPYVFLNEEFMDTAGGIYDTRMYGRLIEDINKHNIDGRKLLSKNICKLQLYPYHSSISPDSFIMNTPSYKTNLEFFKRFLPAVAEMDDMMIIVTRRHMDVEKFLPRQSNVIYFIDVDCKAPNGAQRRFYSIVGERLGKHLVKWGTQ